MSSLIFLRTLIRYVEIGKRIEFRGTFFRQRIPVVQETNVLPHGHQGHTHYANLCEVNFGGDWEKSTLPLNLRVEAVDPHDVLGNHLPNLQSRSRPEDPHLPVILRVVVVVVAVVVVLPVLHLLVESLPPPAKLRQLWQEMVHQRTWRCPCHVALVGLKASGLSTFYFVFATFSMSFKAILPIHSLMTQRALKSFTMVGSLHCKMSILSRGVTSTPSGGRNSHERFSYWSQSSRKILNLVAGWKCLGLHLTSLSHNQK